MTTRFVKAVLVVLAALCFALPAFADSPGWEKLQQDLGLTSAQMAKLKPVMESYRKLRHERFEALFTQIRSLLTPQQQTRLDAMRKEHNNAPSTASPRSHGLQEWIMSLGLSPAQIGQIKNLVTSNIQQVKADHENFMAQLKPILNAEQLARFQELTRRTH